MARKQSTTVNSKSMKELLREHLWSGRSITNVEAQAMWRCRALPKRINELKAEGLNIATERRRDSTGQTYVRYYWADYGVERA